MRSTSYPRTAQDSGSTSAASDSSTLSGTTQQLAAGAFAYWAARAGHG
jgi:hypothetical protein